MADAILSQPENTTHSGTGEEERRIAMLEAAWEIDALARKLPGQLPKEWFPVDTRLVVRGLSARISQLAEAIMSGLDEPEVSHKHIERTVVFGAEQATDDHER